VTSADVALDGDVSTRANRPIAEFASAWLEELRQQLPERVLAIYVARSAFEVSVVRVVPAFAAPALDGYSLEHRFASFLATIDTKGVRAVPTFLQPWLRVDRALVLPLIVRGHKSGALVVEVSALARRDAEILQAMISRISEALARREEQLLRQGKGESGSVLTSTSRGKIERPAG
jgi:hypothetical protein